jgi:hypothetical protein
LDEEIYAKIVATNVYGDSDYSVPGNGATMQLIPDAPINLANDPTVTDASTIRFTWTEGLSNGGTAVIDFDVYYDQGTGTWVTLAEEVSSPEYQTSVTLVANTIYSFKLTAKNTVGDSLVSDIISIRAAEIPDAPLTLSNVPGITTAYQIGLDWSEGTYNGGSPVIDYRVTYKEEFDTDYVLY